MTNKMENQVRCYNCKVSSNILGGAQMKGCHHYLCIQCFIEVVNKRGEVGIKCICQAGKGCDGAVDVEFELGLEAVSALVPPDVYSSYLKRIETNRKTRAVVLPHASELGGGKEERVVGWHHVESLESLIIELTKSWGMSRQEALDYVDSLPILENWKHISCTICLEQNIPVGKGVILKGCFHQFCKSCLAHHIETTDKAEVKCPFANGESSCTEILKPLEIRQLVSQQEYDRHYVQLSLKEAAESLSNVFHCQTPDCKGFCVADPTACVFQCPLCNGVNCVACKAIHPGRSCVEYQRDVERRSNESLLSQEEIDRLLLSKVWMRCPGCDVIIEKNGGCNHMTCKMCSLQFTWTGVQV
ncbi:unnamed protein product [Orchesella dallaii]|uniref:Uncharacterized protein n=1 Tax=Orchesella dallaii TaxID=48710 RepID=A0ABP1QIP9_9HEXA